MRKLLGYILSPFTIIGFLLVLLIFHPLQWFTYKYMGYSAHKKVVDVMDLCLFSVFAILGNRFVFTNHQNLPIGRPIIFISNHQSLMDIPPLIYYLRKYHAKFISKIELVKMPVPSIPFNLKYGGGANIDRNDPRQSITEISKLAMRMKEKKWSAVIFPEGTRAKDGVVQPFQAAGVATILKKCPEALVVPIAINNSWEMVRYGVYPINTFIKMTLDVLEPIEPTGKTADEVVKEAENKVREFLSRKS